MSEEFIAGAWCCFIFLLMSIFVVCLVDLFVSWLRFRDYKRCKKFIRIYEFENNPLNDDDWNGK